MMRANRRWSLGTILVSAIIAGPISAQEPKQLHEKHDTTSLYRSLGEVINFGVGLFNDKNDKAGCYRVYQGSLMTVRPFLASELQKKVDKGLAAAEKETSIDDRAFALRAVLDDVRRQLKPAATPAPEKVEDKKSEKKPEVKKSDAKSAEETKSAALEKAEGQLAGKVTFQGQAVKGGYSITLVRGDKRVSSDLQKDGSFRFKTPIAPGEYAVAVAPIRGVAFGGVPLPPRYEDEKTSGLSITVQGGKQQVDLNLVK